MQSHLYLIATRMQSEQLASFVIKILDYCYKGKIIIEWEREFASCKRKVNIAQHVMAPLPVNGLMTSLRAFTHKAIDFAEPFAIIQGRVKRREKDYLCLFTYTYVVKREKLPQIQM